MIQGPIGNEKCLLHFYTGLLSELRLVEILLQKSFWIENEMVWKIKYDPTEAYVNLLVRSA